MKKQHLKLKKVDRETLESLIRKGKLSARMFQRATGLLELDRGKSLQEVASTLRVHYVSVATWRDRYLAEGLKALEDAPRSGRPPEINGDKRAKITALACSKPPEDYARWSLRLLSDKVVELGHCEGISHTHVGRI